MTCALCHSDKPLMASHVISEFLYQTLYDEKHRFLQISDDPARKNRYKQKGIYEPMLCFECEQHISVFEQYMDRLLNGGIGVGVRRDGNRIYLSDIDYAKLKLFQLSVLWRAGVSKLSVFSQVALGPHEERIRKMLLASEPGPPDLYGCLMFTLMHDKELVTALVVPPTWARLLGHKAYRFVFGGVVFVYVVSSTPVPAFVSENFVQKNGTVTVTLQQMNEMGYLVDTIAKMHQFGKLGD